MPHSTSRRARQATTSALTWGITLFVASVISRFLFHRDLFRSYTFGGFFADVTSLVIAGVGIGLTAILAEPIWKQIRCRLGGRLFRG